jgi:hypothetical protein
MIPKEVSTVNRIEHEGSEALHPKKFSTQAVKWDSDKYASSDVPSHIAGGTSATSRMRWHMSHHRPHRKEQGELSILTDKEEMKSKCVHLPSKHHVTSL